MLKWILCIAGAIALVVIGFAVYWAVQPSKVTAVARFFVYDKRPTLFSRADAYTDSDYPNELQIRRYHATLVERLTGGQVIRSAINHPEMQKVAFLRAVDDPYEWLRDHLEAEFENDSDILVLRLEGNESEAEQLETVVRLVSDAFTDRLEETERIHLSKDIDKLESERSRVLKEIRVELAELEKYRTDSGEGSSDYVETEVREDQLQTQFELLDQLSKGIKERKFDLQAKPRVMLVEDAYIESEE